MKAEVAFRKMFADMGLYFPSEFNEKELVEEIGAQLRGEKGREFRRAFLNRLLVEIVELLMDKGE